MIARRMFAAEIHTPTILDDVRADYASHTYKPCDVPPDIAAGVHPLLDASGLSYAALADLLEDPA